MGELAAWIERYNMKPHPEGGWFVEVFRSAARVRGPRGERSASTAILFALEAGGFSAWHRVHGADEVWHHYEGAALDLHTLDAQGLHARVELCTHAPCAVVRAGRWQAARAEGDVLVGCTVAPGFEFEDFEMAQRTSFPASLRDDPQIAALLNR